MIEISDNRGKIITGYLSKEKFPLSIKIKEEMGIKEYKIILTGTNKICTNAKQ